MFGKVLLWLALLVAVIQATEFEVVPNASNGTLKVFDPEDRTTFSLSFAGSGATIVIPLDDSTTWSRRISLHIGECQELECPSTEIELDYFGGNLYAYDISLLNGFNLQVKVGPLENNTLCQEVSCLTDINEVCPLDNQVVDTTGAVVACKPDADLFESSCSDTITSSGDTSTTILCDSSTYSIIFL